MRTIPAKLRWLLVCCAMSVLLGTAGCRTNPVTGFLEFSLGGPDTELALGHQSHPSIIFMYDGEYRDPELNRYLGTIVMRLHACSHRPEMPTEFTMLSTSVVNAFATPGHVYATRGFLAKLENEAQFSSVMGHELAHVTAGHPAKQMTHRLLTGLAFGVADFAVGDTTVGQVAVGLGQASVALLGLSYSREQERQADRVGTYYMALAGWDARQAIAMQRLLASLNARKETILDRYLSTHPAADDRVAKIQGVLEERGLASARYIQGDGIYADRWNRRLAPLRQADEAFATYDRGVKLMAEKKYGEALASANEAISLQAGRAQF
ncbi:MAG: M48 family metalloprotease, partial [Planctomycetota bacterium]